MITFLKNLSDVEITELLGEFLCLLPSVGALKGAPAHRVASLKAQPVRRDFCGAAGCRVFFSRWRLYRQVIYWRLSSTKFPNKKFWPHTNEATPAGEAAGLWAGCSERSCFAAKKKRKKKCVKCRWSLFVVSSIMAVTSSPNPLHRGCFSFL